ncbi:hypothetical protein A2U01_0093233, partial [Trifolium medium]|nr:hypothetical protein [Trifolium medium]
MPLSPFPHVVHDGGRRQLVFPANLTTSSDSDDSSGSSNDCVVISFLAFHVDPGVQSRVQGERMDA